MTSINLIVSLIELYNGTLGKFDNKLKFVVIIILCALTYGFYKIKRFDDFLAKVKDPKQFLDLTDDVKYEEFYNSIVKEVIYKENLTRFYLESMTRKSDNGKPGSSYTSYWEIKHNVDSITATNRYVTSCYFSFNGEDFFCGDISGNPTYSKTLRINKDFFISMTKASSTGCVSSNLDALSNTENNNFKDYASKLDVSLGDITFCTYDDKLVILSLIIGHNPTRLSKNMNIGCSSSNCYSEMIELKSKLQLLDKEIVNEHRKEMVDN